MLTEKLDEVARLGKARRKDAQSICSARILATDLDGNGGASRAGLDAVCSGELDEIGHTDSSVGLHGLQVTAETLKAPVLLVGTLIRED